MAICNATGLRIHQVNTAHLSRENRNTPVYILEKYPQREGSQEGN